MDNAPSNWKSIVVFLDHTPEGENVGQCAADLAERCGAHLIGIHVLPYYFNEHPSSSFARGREAMHEVVAAQEADGREKALAAQQRFAAIVAKRRISSEMRILRSEQDDDDLVTNSRCCDLHVLGYPDPPGLGGSWSADRLLLETGGPMLVLPIHGKALTVGKRIIVAWNATREARRAVRDAMPLLSAAESVIILVIDPERQRHRFRNAPGVDLAHYLGLHGVHVEISQLKSNGSSVADVILAKTHDEDVDLVVIGGYSHSWIAEEAFGGVTRTLLANASAPLLLST
jgi:nucleotide-binding universal stress UspA family protein